jgi:hypothetical protein
MTGEMRVSLTLLVLATLLPPAASAAPVTRDADRDGRLDAVMLGKSHCKARSLGRLDTGARPRVVCHGRRVRAADGARPVLLSIAQSGSVVRTTWSEPVSASRRAKRSRALRLPAATPLASVAVRDRAGLRALKWHVPAPDAAAPPATAATPRPVPASIPGRPDASAGLLRGVVAAVNGPEGIDPSIAPVRAESAADFLDSIGVNTHLSYFSTAYDDFTKVRQRLGELGVRHLRDHACALCPLQQTRMRILADDGMRFTFVMANPTSNVGTTEQLVQTVESKFSDATAGLESVNEPDMLGLADWVTLTRDHQASLHARVRASATLSRVPVLAPAVVKPANRGPLGDLSGSADAGNLHPYPGGRPPGENLTTTLAQAAVNAPGKPAWITETGYHNALATAKGHKPTSERAAARYTPALFLESFRHGVPRTFIYELLDERPEGTLSDPEQAFGLLRSDFSPKPAFGALRNTIDLVSGSEPGEGALRVAADGTGGAVRTLLLRKSDKRFVVALWPTAAIWDPAARTDVVAAPKAVRLRFGQKVAAADVHLPVTGSGPVAEHEAPAAVDLLVTDEPVLVDVRLP